MRKKLLNKKSILRFTGLFVVVSILATMLWTLPVLAATLTLDPTADGVRTFGLGGWADLIDDNDATYVQTGTGGYSYADYVLADHVAEVGVISEVRVYYRIVSSDASAIYATPGIGLGVSETLGTEHGANGVVTEYNEAIARPGGGAYDWTDIDDMWLVIGMKAPNTGNARCTEAWIVVTYAVLTPPTVTTSAATSLLDNGATLNGAITVMNDATTCDTYFEWDTDSGAPYANTTAKISTLVGIGTFTTSLYALVPNTTYYYRSKVISDAGTAYGGEQNFTTTNTSYLYYNATELTALQARTAETVYVNIKAWGDANLLTACPDDPESLLTTDAAIGENHVHVTDGSKFSAPNTYYLQDSAITSAEPVTVGSVVGNVVNLTGVLTANHTMANGAILTYSQNDWMTILGTVRRYIENMTLLYDITTDTDYSDAAIVWMNSVVDWTHWNYFAYGSNADQWQCPSMMLSGVAMGYDSLNSLMVAGDKTDLINRMVAEMLLLYTRYDMITEPVSYYPNSVSALSLGFGAACYALGADCPAGYLDRLLEYIPVAFGFLTDDGSWFEGGIYSEYGAGGLIPACDIINRRSGLNYFTTEATNLQTMSQWFIWITYNDHYFPIGDSAWVTAMGSTTYSDLSTSYLLAKKYNDGYAQQYSDTYANQDIMQSFVFKNPSVTPLAFSGLGNSKNFSGMGMTFYRSDWTDNALVIYQHSGTSKGHQHPNGYFAIANDGYILSADYGYANGLLENLAWSKNTISEGTDFVYAGYTIRGYANGGEGIWNMGVLADGYHGEIEDMDSTADYWYSRADIAPSGNPPFNPYTYDQVAPPVEALWTGNIDEGIRHMLYIPDIGALVLFDRVSADVASQFNWAYHISNQDGVPFANITVSQTDNIFTLRHDTEYSKLVVVDPILPNLVDTTVSHTEMGDNHTWKELILNPSVDATDVIFNNVLFPDQDDIRTVARVSQDNCSGSIITDGIRQYIVLFSNDGNPVSESIDMGDAYDVVTSGGGVITPNGNDVDVVFTDYIFGELLPAGAIPSDTPSGSMALLMPTILLTLAIFLIFDMFNKGTPSIKSLLIIAVLIYLALAMLPSVNDIVNIITG